MSIHTNINQAHIAYKLNQTEVYEIRRHRMDSEYWVRDKSMDKIAFKKNMLAFVSISMDVGNFASLIRLH